MPRVLNGRGNRHFPGAVRVDRSTIWGNPFVIGKDGTRSEVIAKYEAYLRAEPGMMARLSSLRGKDLVCWCAPKACHADVLVRLANAD